jgi:hypothetical protein
MSSLLIARLKGGLGNQLFCYAAARRLAWFNKAELVLDTITGFKYDYRYRRTYALNAFHLPTRAATPSERMEPIAKLRHLIAHKIDLGMHLENRRYIRQIGIEFDPGILTLRLKEGVTYFDGFGQSELYFDDIRELLLQDLAMTPPSDEHSLIIANQIAATKSVCLHVRWFDTEQGLTSANIPLGYYERAIQQLLRRQEDVHFFIFSDKPKLASVLLDSVLKNHKYTIVGSNSLQRRECDDFWLMQQCESHIMGNSTFAWWAAWLREQTHGKSQIIAPAVFIEPTKNVTAWGFPGLLPERWTLL